MGNRRLSVVCRNQTGSRGDLRRARLCNPAHALEFPADREALQLRATRVCARWWLLAVGTCGCGQRQHLLFPFRRKLELPSSLGFSTRAPAAIRRPMPPPESSASSRPVGDDGPVHNNSSSHTNNKRSKSHSSGAGATRSNARYRIKYHDLQLRVAEMEAENDRMHVKTLILKRKLQRVRLERTYVLVLNCPPSPIFSSLFLLDYAFFTVRRTVS